MPWRGRLGERVMIHHTLFSPLRLRAQEEQAHRLVLADLEGVLARLRRGL
jgi:hypothetical protein